jgi:hypothetical protein
MSAANYQNISTSQTSIARQQRKGSDSERFDRDWNALHSSCQTQLFKLEQNIDSLERLIDQHNISSASAAFKIGAKRNFQVLQLHSASIQINARLNLDIIHLAKITDEQLDLTIEELNTFEQLIVMESKPLEASVSPRLILKKQQQISVSRKFKELANRFQRLQKLVAEISKRPSPLRSVITSSTVQQQSPIDSVASDTVSVASDGTVDKAESSKLLNGERINPLRTRRALWTIPVLFVVILSAALIKHQYSIINNVNH